MAFHLYVIIYLFIYVCIYGTKSRSFGVFPIKKSPEKRRWCFPTLIRHRESDCQLLVHARPRSSATHVTLLAFVYSLALGHGALGCTHTCSH